MQATMWQYVARRCLLALLVLLLVSFVVFSLVRMLPGDTVLLQLSEFGALTPEALEQARRELGLDRPFLEQYGTWMWGLLRGDLGESLTTGRPVSEMLARRINVTLHLAIMSLIISLVVAIPIGILSAIRQDSVLDYGGRLFAILGLSLPNFWIGVVVITYLAIWFNWVPVRALEPIWVNPLKTLPQIIIPAAIIGFRLSAVTMRMTRSSLLEVLREDYIRTAWAKGLRERTVIVRHVLKNAFIPVVTIIGQLFSLLLGGTVIIEFIFLLPGVGSLTLDAVMLRDYTLIQGIVMFFATVMVGMNLLVDLTYAWFDPRIRYQ
jgi:peptide/nickel transport system permease protein